VAASEAWHAAFAPIPQARGNDEEYDAGPQSTAGKLLEGMRQQLIKGPHNPIDVTALSAVIDAAVHGDEIDDRKLLVRVLSYTAHASAHMAIMPKTAREGILHHVQPSKRASQ